MLSELISHTRLTDIVGDICRVRASNVALGELAIVENEDGESSPAKVVAIDGEIVSLQLFAGTKGLSTDSHIRFLGHGLQVSFADEILGRMFSGSGDTIDGGPDLSSFPRIETAGSTVNPMRRVLPSRMIETEVPMIDLFNCLVESQKIPIFSVAGAPYNAFMARIGIQADADIIVFGGLGLVFDD
jgi:V/A-type H+/Na+-transporting ATPase subunit B